MGLIWEGALNRGFMVDNNYYITKFIFVKNLFSQDK